MAGCPSGRTRGKLRGSSATSAEPLASGAVSHGKRPEMLSHGSPLPPARKGKGKSTLQFPYSTTAMGFSPNACSFKSVIQ